MYKNGDKITFEAVVDKKTTYRKHTNTACAAEYFLDLENDVIVVNLGKFFPRHFNCPSDPATGDTVEIDGEVINKSGPYYCIKFPNGKDRSIHESLVPPKFKIGDEVLVECEVTKIKCVVHKYDKTLDEYCVYVRRPGSLVDYVYGASKCEDIKLCDTIKVEAHVTWVAPGGIAVCFDDIACFDAFIEAKDFDKIEKKELEAFEQG